MVLTEAENLVCQWIIEKRDIPIIDGRVTDRLEYLDKLMEISADKPVLRHDILERLSLCRPPESFLRKLKPY